MVCENIFLLLCNTESVRQRRACPQDQVKTLARAATKPCRLRQACAALFSVV
jgi:hypothetical protein